MARRAFSLCGSQAFRRLLVVSLSVLLLSAAAFAGASGKREGSASVLSLDHFQCYQLKPSSRLNKNVTLRDQFARRPVRVEVLSLLTICNPVRKKVQTGTTLVRNRLAHLACYGLKAPGGVPRNVLVSNQFDKNVGLVIGRPVQLCLPSGKSLSREATPHKPRGLDHFECYLLEARSRFSPRSVTLLDEFKREKSWRVVRHTMLCNPVSKNKAKILNPAEHLVCYQLAPKDTGFPAKVVSISNQFTTGPTGKVLATAIESLSLCVPSSKRELR
jgi:hypothetical protein